MGRPELFSGALLVVRRRPSFVTPTTPECCGKVKRAGRQTPGGRGNRRLAWPLMGAAPAVPGSSPLGADAHHGARFSPPPL